MILIIAEKRSVAHAVAKYLGGRYRVQKVGKVPVYFFQFKNRESAALGLSGHIMDFDFSPRENVWTWLPPGELFNRQPLLVVREGAEPYVHALRELAKSATEVYLALDADVEGEAIAYEAALVVRQVNERAAIRRVKFNAVTQRDIVTAFQNPGEINYRHVEKVFTRMQIDLTLGAVFTRFFTLTARHLLRGRVLSYGPCQTPVLNIITTRELERRAFKPEVYYIVKTVAEVGDAEVTLTSVARFNARSEAEAAAAALRRGVVKVAEYKLRQVSPPEPLDTVELERRVSRWLRINAKKTLDVAEELYRAGYISYPRTETTIYPKTLDLREVLRTLAGGHHGEYAKRLLSTGFKPTRGSSDDGAHPPIYPTRGSSREEIWKHFKKLATYAWPIYDFVVRHFLATLSPPAVVEKQKIVADLGIEMAVEGQRTVEEGYWQIYPWERQREKPLPKVRVGDSIRPLRSEVVEVETEPPPPMTESELLALMKKYGIGTDATMQDHIYTNIKRGYVKFEKNKLTPTPLGLALVDVLSRYAPQAIEPTVRGRIEKALANIASGVTSPQRLIDEIKAEFGEYYRQLNSKRDEIKKMLENVLYAA